MLPNWHVLRTISFVHDSTCLRANTHRQARTGRGEVSKINHQFSLWYIFIDSYAYPKLILLILQIIILYIGKSTPFYYILQFFSYYFFFLTAPLKFTLTKPLY